MDSLREDIRLFQGLIAGLLQYDTLDECTLRLLVEQLEVRRRLLEEAERMLD